jgi:hypothetical protein
MTYSHTSGVITFTATATLTTAGKTLGAIVLDATGGTFTLGDAFNSAANFTVTRGTFTTNNYSLTSSNLSISLLNYPTVNLGSSTITVSSSFDCGSGTINAGTSQINLTGSSSSLSNAATNTFYNVSFTSTGANNFSISNNPRRITGTGTATFNDLVLTAADTSLAFLRLTANLIINGTFTATSGSSGPFSRSLVMSDTIGTTRTITAAAISASDCDFRDITLAGAASGASPTRAGDCGGNSGITFPAAKTVYRVTAFTTWGATSSWALTSGGTGNTNNFRPCHGSCRYRPTIF